MSEIAHPFSPPAPGTRWDRLITHVHLATMANTGADTGVQTGQPYGAIENAALAIAEGRIAWLGPQALLDENPTHWSAGKTVNGGGRWVTPGLIDCHTHIIHGGNRAQEFEQRLNGVSYEEIARQGGGILSTVRATRAASAEELLAQSLPRIEALLAEGVTTLEIKSGYGLDMETERAMLRAARMVGEQLPVTVRTTFLGAHALPPEYRDNRAGYLRLLCEEMLPALAAEGLVDAVDAFCERIAFTAEETRTVFEAARKLGLPVKLHAEQISDMNGAALAADFNALSADHLEQVSPEGIRAMARSGTVAVLLPGAFYFLREEKRPPVEALREAGVSIAVATDSNPGTSPLTSLLLAMNMACVLFRLTPEEALRGATRNAAKALGLGETHGILAPGYVADLALWDIRHPAELSYRAGFNPCAAVVRNGVRARG